MNFVPARDFDEELDAERHEQERRLHAIYTHDELVAATDIAREEGRARGVTEGAAATRAQMLESATERTLRALEAVAPSVRQLIEDADSHHAALEAQLTEFVLSVFDRVLPDLMKSQAAARAEAEVRRAIGMALGSAKLTLCLPIDAAMTAGDDLTRRIREAGYEGRVEIMADQDMAEGDVRAEWDSGFMDYSYTAICNQIIAALNEAVPMRRAAKSERASEGAGSR